jgi:hypothetical protein
MSHYDHAERMLKNLADARLPRSPEHALALAQIHATLAVVEATCQCKKTAEEG